MVNRHRVNRDHTDLLHVIFGIVAGCFFLAIGYLNGNNPSSLIGVILCYIVGGISFLWALFVLVIWSLGKKLQEMMFGNSETRKYF